MKIFKVAVVCLTLVGLFNVNSVIAANNASGGKASRYSLSYEQIKMAAESGDADAQYALGYMYYYGKGGAAKDINLAKNWIGKAASQKQPQAVKALALMNAHPTSGNQYASNQGMNNVQQQNYPQSNQSMMNNREKMNSETPTPPVDNSKENMTLVDMRNKKENSEADNAEAVAAEGVFTLQLLGASNKDQIVRLVRDNHLANKAKIYKTTFKNKDWYVLLYGTYKTKSEARLESERLENKLAVKPWIKPYASVQKYKLMTIAAD